MGSPEDEWGHPAGSDVEDQVSVTLTRAFLIQQHEVTQAEWTSRGLPNPTGLVNGTGDCLEPTCPIGNVTWFEALAFANLLSEAEGFAPCYELIDCQGTVGEGMACYEAVIAPVGARTVYECDGYRLPTEPEWEYAARAGTTTAFYSGPIKSHPPPQTKYECLPDPNLDSIAWYCDNAGPTTHPVGQKQPNAFGLYDVSGNSHEWVNDHITFAGYGEGPLVDPQGALIHHDTRVWRGGMFNLWPAACRLASRLYAPWDSRGPALGFRLARTLHDDR